MEWQAVITSVIFIAIQITEESYTLNGKTWCTNNIELSFIVIIIFFYSDSFALFEHFVIHLWAYMLQHSAYTFFQMMNQYDFSIFSLKSLLYGAMIPPAPTPNFFFFS